MDGAHKCAVTSEGRKRVVSTGMVGVHGHRLKPHLLSVVDGHGQGVASFRLV